MRSIIVLYEKYLVFVTKGRMQPRIIVHMSDKLSKNINTYSLDCRHSLGLRQWVVGSKRIKSKEQFLACCYIENNALICTRAQI